MPSSNYDDAGARIVCVFGTHSDCGKSFVTTGLCRNLMRRGLPVRPFKPQNLSLNSGVAPDGREVARAQIVQAQAAGVEPTADMSPVILKWEGDGFQCVLRGVAVSREETAKLSRAQRREKMRSAMDEGLAAVRAAAPDDTWIIVEGAGAVVEPNLRDVETTNFAVVSKLLERGIEPVVLIVADLSKGGAFAHLLGTYMTLQPHERSRVAGFVMNRCLDDGKNIRKACQWIEEQTGIPVVATVHNIENGVTNGIDEEDQLRIPSPQPILAARDDDVVVVVPRLPLCSNHTDFDALRLHPTVRFHLIDVNASPPPERMDIVLLGGSKNPVADLECLQAAQGGAWVRSITEHAQSGGAVVGLCGGYQLLGKALHLADGRIVPALGLLNVDTDLAAPANEKVLQTVRGFLTLRAAGGATAKVLAKGYEMHTGRTFGEDCDRPVFTNDGPDAGADGATAPNGRVWGTYVHGCFDDALDGVIAWARGENPVAVADAPKTVLSRNEQRERGINAAADACEVLTNWLVARTQ